MPVTARIAGSTNSSLGSGVAIVGGEAASAAPSPQRAGGEAARLLPLPWPGGDLDAGYAQRQRPFQVETPPGLRRALLVATLTGHGQDRLYK